MSEEQPKPKAEVETYAGAMAEVAEGNEGVTIRDIIEEQSAYEEAQREDSPEAVKNKFYLYAGIFFILAALGLISYLVSTRENLGTVPVESQFTPIIFIDETSFVKAEGGKSQIAKELRTEISTAEIKQGGVHGLYLTKDDKIVGLSGFLELIKAGLPGEKVFLFGENFLMGAVNENERGFFILLPVQSFAESFNEMRNWEKKMFFDLHDLFGLPLNTSTEYLLAKNFEDGIVENKNARILYEDSGEIAMMYVFVDHDFIIIADTEGAVSEVMLRLAGSKIKK